MTFVHVASFADLWEGDFKRCAAGGTQVLLARVGGAICAYEDKCPHLGARLSEGKLQGHVITCARHHFQYDARTGEGINPRSLRLRRFATSVVGDGIVVDVTREVER